MIAAPGRATRCHSAYLTLVPLHTDVIDGKAIAQDIRNEIKTEVAKLKEQKGKVSSSAK